MLDKKKITSIKKYIKELKGLVYTPLIEVNNGEIITILALEGYKTILKIKNTIDNTEHIYKHGNFDYNINVLNVSINQNSIITYHKLI